MALSNPFTPSAPSSTTTPSTWSAAWSKTANKSTTNCSCLNSPTSKFSNLKSAKIASPYLKRNKSKTKSSPKRSWSQLGSFIIWPCRSSSLFMLFRCFMRRLNISMLRILEYRRKKISTSSTTWKFSMMVAPLDGMNSCRLFRTILFLRKWKNSLKTSS